MPDVDIMVGGRMFQVACQPGEEHLLRAAAEVLDAEARPLVAQMGRLPESRMLLMAALMLADRMAALEDERRALKAEVSTLQNRAHQLRADVAEVPDHVVETLAELAARAEALATAAEERAGHAA